MDIFAVHRNRRVFTKDVLDEMDEKDFRIDTRFRRFGIWEKEGDKMEEHHL